MGRYRGFPWHAVQVKHSAGRCHSFVPTFRVPPPVFRMLDSPAKPDDSLSLSLSHTHILTISLPRFIVHIARLLDLFLLWFLFLGIDFATLQLCQKHDTTKTTDLAQSNVHVPRCWSECREYGIVYYDPIRCWWKIETTGFGERW